MFDQGTRAARPAPGRFEHQPLGEVNRQCVAWLGPTLQRYLAGERDG